MTPPEVTSPEEALTGNDVTGRGSDRKWHHQNSRNRKSRQSRKWSHAQPVPSLFSYYSSSTKCIIAHHRHCYRKWRDRRLRDPERRFPWKAAPMHNRKLLNIRTRLAFSLEITSSNITCRASPGKYGSANSRPEVPFGCSLGRPRPITLSFSTN
jgi:hypothetical protein